MSTITLTFGDCAENHIGMEVIGEEADRGYSYADLRRAKRYFEKRGKSCRIYRLHHLSTSLDLPKAYFLLVREAVPRANKLLSEQLELPFDRKYYDRRRSKVLNKHARYNLCFSEQSQEPDYEAGKGRIVAFDELPELKRLRTRIGRVFPDSTELQCEANHYYRPDCGIGYHGDGERKKVVGVRLGETMSLHFNWFCRGEPVGSHFSVMLNHGDLYAFCGKAVGTDWKRRSIYTLRHAAGGEKYTKL